jgi:sugar/nucleoside kinase (ribokinase family)
LILCAGSFMCDLIAAHLPYVPGPGGLVYAPEGIDLRTGGHAANVAMDLKQLGEPSVAAAGGVGEDALGEYMVETLRGHGVDARPQRVKGYGTAKNVALIVEGEDKRFIAELAANTMLSPDHVEAVIGELTPSAFYLGTVGGLRLIDPEIPRLLDAAHWVGAATYLDVIMPFEKNWDHLRRALSLVNVLHCNDAEAAAITGQKDPAEAARWISNAGPVLAVVTLGKDGLVAATREATITVPPFRVRQVDPTGAGDALCAGVIHAALARGLNRAELRHIDVEIAKEVLMEGEAAGAACVTEVGATEGVTREHVDSLIQGQGTRVLAGARVL